MKTIIIYIFIFKLSINLNLYFNLILIKYILLLYFFNLIYRNCLSLTIQKKFFKNRDQIFVKKLKFETCLTPPPQKFFKKRDRGVVRLSQLRHI